MTALNVQYDLTQDRQKIRHNGSFAAVTIVFILFLIQILITPLTFSSWWHCPMMMDAHASAMPMNMDDCMHMNMDEMDKTIANESHNSKHQQHPMQNSGMNCPLCISYTLPTALLTYTANVSNATMMVLSSVHVAYYALAPPSVIINANRSRAPPLF